MIAAVLIGLVALLILPTIHRIFRHRYVYSEMNMAAINSLLLDRLTVRESQLYQQADALDLKASILLVAIIFLATQTSAFLRAYSKGAIYWEQVIAGAVEILTSACLAFILLPRSGYVQEPAEDYPKWRDELIAAEISSDDSTIAERMVTEIVDDLSKHCEGIRKINDTKAKWLVIAHWGAFAALLTDVASVVTRLFSN